MTTQAVFEDVVVQTNLQILHILFTFVNNCGKECDGSGSLAILVNVTCMKRRDSSCKKEIADIVCVKVSNVLSCVYCQSFSVWVRPFPRDPAAELHAYNEYLYLYREMKSFALLKKANMGTVEEHY